ncbi:MAG: hypothetical protein ABL883_01395 [Terricaulis sp.]
MAKNKTPERQGQAAAPKAAAASAPTVDPRQVAVIALDAEIAQLKAQLAALEKQGGGEAAVEQVRKLLSLRAIQRVTLG